MPGKYSGPITAAVKQKQKLFLLVVFVLALLQVSALQLFGQNPDMSAGTGAPGKLKAPEFEVATIKPGIPDQDGSRSVSLNISPGGRIQITNWTLTQLICAAYNLSYWQLQGATAWMERDFYDIEAKPADPGDGSLAYSVRHGNWSLDDPQLRVMLQALLENRFQLKAHIVVKQGPIWVLERGNGELSLTPSTSSENPARSGRGGSIGFSRGVVINDTTMPQLAALLEGGIFHQPVIDKTGLTGSYDFRSKTTLTGEDAHNLDPNSIMDLFTQAVKEMGLKLTRSTGSVTTLVIDQAAHPSPN